jgi:tryptophan synthase alpha chain
MNRIEERMKLLQAENKKAFITYTTAGLPDLEKTKGLIRVQEAAGIDVIELGIPFSDPVADGPVIQNASYQAIQSGTTLKKIFTMMEEVRNAGSEVPIIFMMYFNTILHYGIKEFTAKCIACGVDGLIIPDLPFEEQGQLTKELDTDEKAPILIQLVSPVSKQRIPTLLEHARGFVYCVSQMGVTGNGANFHKDIHNYLSEVKKASKIPVMMGFGIRTAQDVKPLKDVMDGAIVGSHFIRLLQENNYSEQVVTDYIKTFQQELNQ